VALSGTQWYSVIISGTQWPSVIISSHQWSSVVISSHQRSSVVISGHQCEAPPPIFPAPLTHCIFPSHASPSSSLLIPNLLQWCASVLGKPYQLPLSKLLDHFGSPKATDAPKGDEPGSEAVQKGFFCSELLAHAWKAIDILPAQHPASGFWPRDFGAAATHRLRLQHGASLGDELPLDFCTPGVASLLRIPTFSRAPPDGVDDAVASDDSSSAGAASDEY